MGRATINDVARVAGTGRTTVSRVINDAGYVSAASRRRIEAAIDELDYRPRLSARTLKSRTVSTVGLVTEDPADPVVARVIRGVVREAAACRIVVAVSMAEVECAPRRVEPQGDFGGHLFVASVDRFAAAVDRLRRWGPTVLLGEPAPWEGTYSVLADPGPAAFDLAHRVALLGHRRVVIVGISENRWLTTEYACSLQAGLLAAGIPADQIESVSTDPSVGGGRAAAERILQRNEGGRRPPTAFLCGADDVARGVIELCLQRGLRVPSDVSVTGFGDSPGSSTARPQLTTAAIPAEQLGALGLRLLIDRMSVVDAVASVRTIPATVLGRGSLARASR